MRCRSFLALWALSAGALCLLVGCEFLQTPEGQAAGSQTVRGAAGLLANPVNPFAWYDFIVGGAALALGAAGVVKGPAVAKAAGGAFKRTFMNSAVLEASSAPAEAPTVVGFKGA